MKRTFVLLASCLMLLSLAASSQQQTASTKRAVRKTAKIQYGIASFYHNKFQGRKTASGENFDQQKMTAAHNSLPLNTWIRVTSLSNGKSVIVKVNDRLHHRNTRLVDLSRAAASDLGYVGKGITRVKVEVLGKKKPQEADEPEEAEEGEVAPDEQQTTALTKDIK